MEYVSGNIYVREGGPLAQGDVVAGHTHHFDHTTYVAKGAIRFERLDDDGKVVQSVVKRAGELKNWVLIKAECSHRLTALKPGSVYHCIYAHRTPQGDVVQEYDGWTDAYS